MFMDYGEANMDKKVLKVLNEQVNHEFFAAYLYLSMSTYFEAENLKGFANWMRMQYEEEIIHALKIFDYIHDRGEHVVLMQIDTPKAKWKSPLEAFSDAYAHEQKVTALINNIIDVAEKAKDRATMSFMQWYIDEQVEEEAQTSELVDKLKLIKDNPYALLMIDKELAGRAAPAQPAAA